ncbi:MAG: SLATT domain-containing protein [Chitinophagales bacterium]|nr:SLATT domain-containing protein [Chitinophagales bacterium]
MNKKNYAETLYEKLWKTKGTRFIAHKRLEHVNQLSNWAVALNSVYVIIASLLSIKPFSDYSKLTPEYLSLLTIFLSLIIIVLSLIENSKNYKAKADSLHQCGKDLNQLYERLEQIKYRYDEAAMRDEIEKLGSDYQKIIDKYPENHLSMDYDLFVASDRELTKSKFDSFITKLRIWLRVNIPYYLAILIPFLCIALMIKKP